MPPKEKLARGRGSAFNKDELSFLLTNVEKVIPVGITGWDTIEKLHKEQYPARNSEALKRKFEALHKSEVPPDENNVMYTHIIRAKAARQTIVDAGRTEEVDGSNKIKQAGDGTERKSVKKDVSSDVNTDSKVELKKQINHWPMTAKKQRQMKIILQTMSRKRRQRVHSITTKLNASCSSWHALCQ
jgi:hypothetical protein